MYQVAHYCDTNTRGTAVLLEALIKQPVERLVIASSMSLYGEGLYRTPRGELRTIGERTLEQLRHHDWDSRDAEGSPLIPVPTPETKTPALSSVYALTKYDQERLCLMIGRAYSIPTVALRFFNAYGPRQALSNPYTGVLAIFAARLLNDSAPQIFEDGCQKRDFVSVYDVAQACRLALETPAADGEVFNVASGHAYTIREIAERLGKIMGKADLRPQITDKYRMGDIRHCFADIEKARRFLGYAPRVDLDGGLTELAGWLEGKAAIDRVAQASAELATRGLTV
jgi:dTDP-L-rhamnose 4-epimerase